MTRPNFFIVGAPKSGTTALSVYLRTHPNVYFSDPKEPNYFNSDFSEAYRYRRVVGSVINSEEGYLRLFREATEEHVAIGEGTVWYLYSDVALYNIQKFQPSAKIIVMLRDPVDMVCSLHSQLRYSLNEEIDDFFKAWVLQEERSRGNMLPVSCQESKLLQYRRIANYEIQLDRLYSIFPKDNILIVIFEDFIENTAREYERVLKFLRLDHDGRTSFPPVNRRKYVRSQGLHRLVVRPPKWIQSFAKGIKATTGLKSLGVGKLVNRWNKDHASRPKLPPEFRRMLRDCFDDDIQAVERRLSRELASWRD